MKRKTLKHIGLRFVSLMRATIVTAGVSVLYIAGHALYFGGDFSKTEEVLLPCIGAALIFFGLILADTSWVENNLKS